jgi:hypothetical protein
MESDGWAAWSEDVFGDPYLVWHEGPDFQRLLELARSDPAGVERMLAVGVRAEQPLAAQSIEALADAGLAFDGAVTLLRAAVPTATERFLLHVAQALHVLTGEESWARLIVTVLHSDAHWGVRMDAARALAEFPRTPQLVAALGQAVCDDEYLVRYHAANTLLRYAGDRRDVSGVPALFAALARPAEGSPSAADRTAWRAAADRLTSM